MPWSVALRSPSGSVERHSRNGSPGSKLGEQPQWHAPRPGMLVLGAASCWRVPLFCRRALPDPGFVAPLLLSVPEGVLPGRTATP